MDYGAASFFLALGLAIGAGLSRLYDRWWKVRHGVVIEVDPKLEQTVPLVRLDSRLPPATYFVIAVTVRNRMDTPLKITNLDFLTSDGGRVMLDTFESPGVIPPHEYETWCHSRHDEYIKGTYAVLVSDGAGRQWKHKVRLEPDLSELSTGRGSPGS